MVQPTSPQANSDQPRQAITGLVPPSVAEARIREARPTLLGIQPAGAALAKRLVRTVFLAPLGWMIQAPLFAMKFGPITTRRYTLTNRRLMVRQGWKGRVKQEVALAEIDDVHLDPGKVDNYYLSGDLEVLSGGKVVLRLPGVPEPEGFRQAILNAVKAWVPGKAKGPWIAASANPGAS
jgi:hypothetical protein